MRPNCVDHWENIKAIGEKVTQEIFEALNDYVPVVRCKDCKWYNPKSDDPHFLYDFWCDNDDGMGNPTPEDYCSLGERREDETD